MILVTGVTGHIGTVLVRKMLEKGLKVRALVVPGDDETAIKGLDLEVVYGDVTDLESIRRAMPGVQHVFHLAAVITILPGRQPQVYRVNVDGTRNMLKALLTAMLVPSEKLKQLEADGDYTSRLALMEDAKMLPYGAVWDYYCETKGVPAGHTWLAEAKRYEREVLAKRQ